VHVSVSRKTYANLLPAEILDQFSVERRAKQWHEMIEMPDSNTAVFVAEDADNLIVGFGCCSRRPSEALATKGFAGEFQ
jgi:pyruvate/2-oxoacid:ferredoxin oxidoreductase alpha subunit